MIRKFFIIILFLAFFISCDDSFNPFGDYKDSYVLTCVLRSDSTKQIATISQSFPDLNSNTSGDVNWIQGAEVTVWQEDSVYVFKDSSAVINDPAYGQINIQFYYHPNVVLKPNKFIEIEALLASGKRLKSQGYTPGEIVFNTVSSSIVIPPINTENYIVVWNTVAPGLMYDIKFQIRYLKKVNGVDQEFMIEVPEEYVVNNGEEVPVYPKPNRNTSASFKMEAVNKIMQLISQDDPDKSNYSVYQVPLIQVVALDEGLSRYYSASSGSLEDLTVRVNSIDYTNIEGGFGIFGSYFKTDFSNARLLPEYIQSFGYNVKYEK